MIIFTVSFLQSFISSFLQKGKQELRFYRAKLILFDLFPRSDLAANRKVLNQNYSHFHDKI